MAQDFARTPVKSEHGAYIHVLCPQLFDVREPDEAASGKLRAAELVPLSELQQGMPPPTPIPRDKLTYVHCAAGIRVHYAAPILEAMGFERVVPLQEGFATLRSMGFPSD